MTPTQTLTHWMTERGITLAELIDRAGLGKRVVEAIAAGRYTPSPDQRRVLATALGVELEQIAWGHTNEVSHVYGHGPQFGRSP